MPSSCSLRLPLSASSFVFGLLLLMGSAQAQLAFDENDWIAWGDSRQINSFHEGPELVYYATPNGVLRWNKIDRRWLTPLLSVPGDFDHAFFLFGALRVIEDPVSRDLYVLTDEGWLHRQISNERWRRVDEPPSLTMERIEQKSRPDSPQPSRGVIAPHGYQLDGEGALLHGYQRWPFSGGWKDSRDNLHYSWQGFGIGRASDFSVELQLYPGGPGSARALAVTDGEIWAAGKLDYQFGWLWQRDRSVDHWDFLLPEEEWGLVEATVGRLRVGPDGTVWIASDEGVMFGRKSWKRVSSGEGLPRRTILDVAPLRGGAWVATQLGAAYIDSETGAVRRPDKEHSMVARSAMLDRLALHRDTLYAAGSGTLLRHVPGQVWQEIEGPGLTAAASPATALFAGGGRLALGDAKGFAWRDSSGNWHELSARRYEGGVVLAIEWHDGLFWLGTDRGLARFDPVRGDLRVYDREEGLPGRVVREVFAEGDWLWLSVDGLLVRFLWHTPRRIE